MLPLVLAVLALAAPGTVSAKDGAAQILEHEQRHGRPYEILEGLCDDVGNRIVGSENAAKAVEWGKKTLQECGADRVVLEPCTVKKWVRGDVERAEIVAPSRHVLAVLALGGSIATPPGGITAPVMVVTTFDELKQRAAEAKGKIVLFNRAMGDVVDGKTIGYGGAVTQRVGGAIEAAKAGAVASVIRSVGTKGAEYRLPHTGVMRYADDVTRIPHAAIAAEDADLIVRLVAKGEPVSMKLELSCRDEGTAPSFNVVADFKGREKPDEIVLIGGHLDSWDVGQGAQDDGTGVASCIEVIRVLKALDLRPRRTVRCVLFMSEENGGAGAEAYAEAHAGEVEKHVAAIEMDGGSFKLMGFGVSAGAGAKEDLALLADAGQWMSPLGAVSITPGGGGTDIEPLGKRGVPQIGLHSDSEIYFRYHHTQADTLDKVDPQELRRCAAGLAVMTWALAEMDGTLPRVQPGAGR